MILNERKIKILEAIINDYIETAEPIGSRTIAKKYDLGISSATIRNEMSDLEELGLIVQPHTSSGRVPSDKGYRLYVDRLMNTNKLSKEDAKILQRVIAENINHMDYLMQQTAKAISAITSYTSVVSEPKTVKRAGVRHVQLVPLDERSVIAVIVTDTKVIKNQVINLRSVPDIDEINKISNAVNDILKKYPLETIEENMQKDLSAELGEYEEIIKAAFNAVFEVIREEEAVSFYTSGVNNILDFPEFSDIEKAKGIFKALEEKEMLVSILNNSDFNDNSVQILIGDENNLEQLKNCSIIKAKYNIGDAEGTIGIIGPTRMNYAQTVSVLNEIVKNINRVIKALSDG